jgi:hypothetical protein
VIVPDGAYPGQVLHVTVPDGSGRVVAATVPPGLSPGTVFMVECPAAAPGVSANLPVATPVSYPPQVPQQQTATAAAPYYPPQQYQQPIQAQPYNYGQQQYNYDQSRPASTSGGGVAPVIAGVAGAAMLAGAAGLAYEHFHHNQDDTEYVDNSYNDDGGGFGGDY